MKAAAWVAASDSAAMADDPNQEVFTTVFESILEMEIADMHVGMVTESWGF